MNGIGSQVSGPAPRKCKVRMFNKLEPGFPSEAVADLVKEFRGYSENELIEEGRKAINIAAAGSKALTDLKVHRICCSL
jgi:hypothetical protein